MEDSTLRFIIFLLIPLLSLPIVGDEWTKKDNEELGIIISKFPRKLPVELTSKNWKKAKGFLETISKGKTGISKTLREVEELFSYVSGDNRAFLKYPDVNSPSIKNAKDFSSAWKKNYDAWKEMKNLKAKLIELEKLAETLEKKWTKKKKPRIAVGKVKKKAQELSKEIKEPKKWRKKIKACKKSSIAFIKAIDSLKAQGMTDLHKMKIAVGYLDHFFGGRLEIVCEDYLSKIVSKLEKLKDKPDELAKLFNKKYLGRDYGARTLSQGLKNVAIWKKFFGVDFPYSKDEIEDAMKAFAGWGGGKREWTAENALTELQLYKKSLEDIIKWSEKHASTWERDRSK